MIYENKRFDAERSLYGVNGDTVINCSFEGPADGESPFKESKNITVDKCRIRLRYPFWHTKNAKISNCELTDTCRAALWYDEGIEIRSSRLGGIKALRECKDMRLSGCEITSEEFGWKCHGVKIKDCTLKSVYPFMLSKDMEIENLDMTGKYSFQYVENTVVRNCNFDTKDAFWHSKNMTVYDSVIRGEYLAWYSEGLTLVRCKIIGTQPFCYCTGLRLIDCEMEDADLAFEYSDVEADIRGHIVSIKNPHRGYIKCDTAEEIINDENLLPGSDCEITLRNEKSN